MDFHKYHNIQDLYWKFFSIDLKRKIKYFYNHFLFWCIHWKSCLVWITIWKCMAALFEFSNFNALTKRGHKKVRIIHRMGGTFSLTNRYFVWIFNPADRIILQGVWEKLWLSQSTANQPSPSYSRDLLSLTQCGCTVTLIGVLFSVQPTIAAQCWRRDCRILTIL